MMSLGKNYIGITTYSKSAFYSLTCIFLETCHLRQLEMPPTNTEDSEMGRTFLVKSA